MRYIRLMTHQFVTAFAVLVNQASPSTPASTTSTAATASNGVDKLTGVTGPLVLWSMVPETKGRSLEEIERGWTAGKNNPSIRR